MKIIRLSTFLDFGGLEKRMINLSHVSDNNEWVFICLNNEGFAANQIKNNNKRVENLNVKPSIYSLKATRKLYKFLKREKPDILHTSGSEANFHGVLAGRMAGIKTIIAEEIGIPSQSYIAKIVFRIIYSMADKVIGNSKPVLDYIHQCNGVPLRKLHKVNNPIIFSDLNNFNFSFQPLQATHIVSVSRLTSIKNIPAVIQIINRLNNEGENLIYHIYGTGEEYDNLSSLINEFNANQKIILHGFEKNPLEKLKAADIFIINSHTEGFSNALCEAMYAKTLSISTKCGSAEDMIEHNSSGFLVNVNDSENLYQQLKQVLQIPDEQKHTIRQKAHDKVVKNYSLGNHLNKLYEIYK